MEVTIVLLVVIAAIVAIRVVRDDPIEYEPCEHEVKQTSYQTGVTRCIECGEVLEDD